MSDRKEYIERGALEEKLDRRLKELRKKYGYFDHYTDGFDEAVDAVSDEPAADVVEVVRCRDCKKRYVPAYCALWYGQINDEHGCRDIFLRAHNDDFYCAYGERKDSADDE